MIKIWIDISHYNKLSGYWLVTREILKKLVKNQNLKIFLLSNEEKDIETSIKTEKNVKIIYTSCNYFLYRLRKQWLICNDLWLDIFFSFDQFVPIIEKKNIKYINIIHDIDEYVNFSWFKAIFYYSKLWLRKQLFFNLFKLDRFVINKSDSIISPSHYTKNNLVNHMNILSEKIYVIYRWIDHIPSKLYFKKKDYVLFPLCHWTDWFIYNLANKIIEQKLTKEVIIFKPLGNIEKNIILKKEVKIINKKLTEKEKYKFFWESKCAIYISDGEWFWFVPLECIYLWTHTLYYNNYSLWEIVWKAWTWIKEKNTNIFLKKINFSLTKNRKNILKKLYNRETTTEKILDIISKLS